MQVREAHLCRMGVTDYIIFPFSQENRMQNTASLNKLHYTLNTATQRSKVFLHCLDVIVECVYTGIAAAPVFKCVSPPTPKCWIKYIILIYCLLGY